MAAAVARASSSGVICSGRFGCVDMSAALETRRAFFDEGLHAFRVIVGRPELALQIALQIELLMRGLLRPGARGWFDRGNRARCLLGGCCGGLPRDTRT